MFWGHHEEPSGDTGFFKQRGQSTMQSARVPLKPAVCSYQWQGDQSNVHKIKAECRDTAVPYGPPDARGLPCPQIVSLCRAAKVPNNLYSSTQLARPTNASKDIQAGDRCMSLFFGLSTGPWSWPPTGMWCPLPPVPGSFRCFTAGSGVEICSLADEDGVSTVPVGWL